MERKVYRQWLLLLIAVVSFGIAIRSYRLGEEVLSNDEAFSWRLTRYKAPDLVAHAAGDVHPPLCYIVFKAWLALWGTLPGTLRGLSVLFGALCVGMVYLASLEACQGERGSGGLAGAPNRGGPLLAAFLAGVHLAQVVPGRTARMYALGAFLAGLTAWLLLRALRAQSRCELWWTVYGLAAAAFAYTHYYAFFTLAAQALFVVGDLVVRAWKGSFRHAVGSGLGFLFAALLATALYSPWLPVLADQTREVRHGFWVPPVTTNEAERVFFSWSTGLEYPGAAESRLWLVVFAVVAVWTVLRGRRAAWYFLLQAALPWALSLGLSVYTGRSIFLERCLVFAHVALLGFWAVAWYTLPGLATRLLLALWLGTTALVGLWEAARQWPSTPPALAVAADYLKEDYRDGDLILADSPANVNRLRYYLSQAGLTEVNVRCIVNPFRGEGHTTHIASLDADDIIWSGREVEIEKAGRVWRASEHGATGPPSGEGWREVRRETFTDERNTRWTVVLYER